MARGSGAVLTLAVLLLHASCAVEAVGQKKLGMVARREDILQCLVCERIAREVSRHVTSNKQELPSKKRQEADWMLQIDIMEKGDKLEINSLVFCGS